MSSYKSKFELLSNNELLEMANSSEHLNADAKYALHNILKGRKEIDSDRYSLLEVSLNDQFSKIESLEYLKNIGFSSNESGNELVIRRSIKATIWDIVGVILGVFLMILLGAAFTEWKSLFIDEFNSQKLAAASINTFFGILGFFLFYKGMNRLLEYSNFSIAKSESGLMVKKQGITNIESVLSTSSLYFEIDDQKAILGIDINGKTPLIVTKENSLFRSTLESLYNKLLK